MFQLLVTSVVSEPGRGVAINTVVLKFDTLAHAETAYKQVQEYNPLSLAVYVIKLY